MPRKGPAPKRVVAGDPVYHNRLVAQLINQVLRDGKKGVAESIVYGALEIIEAKTASDPVALYKKALDNVKPHLEVRSRRVGGATYQVPIEVAPRRSAALALRWIEAHAVARRERKMAERLAGELMDAANGTGASIKKKEDLFKMAEANRAFAHYRW